MDFQFSWRVKDEAKETKVEMQSNSVSKTLLKVKELFMEQINAFMEAQNLDQKEEALFEEVVSDEEPEGRVGSKRGGQRRQRRSKKSKPNYGKKSR